MSSHAALALHPWPPDDSEESIVGTDRHQMTIMTVRWGLNEAAVAATPPGQPLRWQAGSQIAILGFVHPDGTAYRTMPDVFVYRQPFDQDRTQLTLAAEGPPVLIVEVLSASTERHDRDLAAGKGYSYARGGVAEYLLLDPGGAYLPGGVQGQGWRLEDGVYVPWRPDGRGRWVSGQVAAAIGLAGIWAVVYGPEGQAIPREGTVLRAQEQWLERGLERGRAEGLEEGRAEE